MVTLNVDPANAPVESVSSRYDREWLQLQDDRKVRGYDMRSAERRARDFVDPAALNVTSNTTESDIEDGGVILYDTTVTVTGTVGAQGDNDNGVDVNALKADLPNRGESY